MPALCAICGDFHAYPGFIACDQCLTEHGEDPAHLETVASHRASIRSIRLAADRAQITQSQIDGLFRTLKSRVA